MAKTLTWSLLFNAMLPIGLIAREEKGCATCPTEKVLHANVVDTDKLHVKCNASVGGDLKVGEDALIKGDLTVKGEIHGKFSCHDNVADYIVIGMGGAGAVIAKRLTDDKKTSVIGLEAGDNNSEDPAIIIPENGYLALFPAYFPQYFWQGQGVPQQNMDNRSFVWSSGRLLGGGTSINGMQYVRGSNAYWSNMATLLGPDWSLKKVLKRYKALETYISPFPASPGRGTKGPWYNVALPFNPTDDDIYLFNAQVAASGIPSIPDFNNPFPLPSGTPNGVSLQYDTSERPSGDVFLREATPYAFLNSDVMTPDGIGVNGRKLRVHMRATAIDLLWNKNKVIGIRYTQNGQAYEIFARKDVIICAGFQSAQILQRNGIGPKDVLNAAGVPVRVDSPLVGQLRNHVYVDGAILAPPGTVILPTTEPWTIWGPGAMLPAITPVADPHNAPREIQWLNAPFGTDEQGNVLMIFAAGLVVPKSIGSIAIQNDDPLKIPLANENFLSNPEDIDKLVSAYQHFGLALANYFEANPSPKGTWTFLGPTKEMMANPDPTDLINFIKANGSQAHHYCCQCPAGLSSDVAVVDPYGKVFGVEGLRVADVSILPYIPDGNTGAPAVLIGWTISDFIMAGK